MRCAGPDQWRYRSRQKRKRAAAPSPLRRRCPAALRQSRPVPRFPGTQTTPSAQEVRDQFGESRARARLSDELRLIADAIGEARDIRHADRMDEEGEHRRVIWRIANI